MVAPIDRLLDARFAHPVSGIGVYDAATGQISLANDDGDVIADAGIAQYYDRSIYDAIASVFDPNKHPASVNRELCGMNWLDSAYESTSGRERVDGNLVRRYRGYPNVFYTYEVPVNMAPPSVLKRLYVDNNDRVWGYDGDCWKELGGKYDSIEWQGLRYMLGVDWDDKYLQKVESPEVADAIRTQIEQLEQRFGARIVEKERGMGSEIENLRMDMAAIRDHGKKMEEAIAVEKARVANAAKEVAARLESIAKQDASADEKERIIAAFKSSRGTTRTTFSRKVATAGGQFDQRLYARAHGLYARLERLQIDRAVEVVQVFSDSLQRARDLRETELAWEELDTLINSFLDEQGDIGYTPETLARDANVGLEYAKIAYQQANGRYQAPGRAEVVSELRQDFARLVEFVQNMGTNAPMRRVVSEAKKRGVNLAMLRIAYGDAVDEQGAVMNLDVVKNELGEMAWITASMQATNRTRDMIMTAVKARKYPALVRKQIEEALSSDLGKGVISGALGAVALVIHGKRPSPKIAKLGQTLLRQGGAQVMSAAIEPVMGMVYGMLEGVALGLPEVTAAELEEGKAKTPLSGLFESVPAEVRS